MMPYFHFQPIYQSRVWGGHDLEKTLGRSLPGSGPIGESWEIVDRPEAQSVVSEGPLAGKTLHELLTGQSTEVMGPGWQPGQRFPILVKWLDCQDRLSLQVHPPTAVAASLAGEPKTENWYVARATPAAAVLAGLKPGVDQAQFALELERGTAESCVQRMPVHAGDSLLVHSGVMHAIDAGCLILEIQQNSDTTYRVFDWGRVGLDGKPRQLHIAEALACLSAPPAGDTRLMLPTGKATEVLADCAHFRITRHLLPAGGELRYLPGVEPRLLSVVEGALAASGGGRVRAGDNLLLPYAGDFLFRADEPAVILVTDHFNRPTA